MFVERQVGYSCGQYYKTFLGLIYTISDTFPYDFDWGYADSNLIIPRKF